MADWRSKCRCCDAPPAPGRCWCARCLREIERVGTYLGDIPSREDADRIGVWKDYSAMPKVWRGGRPST